jgi:hypothetical protein
MAGLVCAVVPGQLVSAPFSARAWQAVALGVLLTAVAVTGAMVLAGGLAALPALVRFVRAGGWPKIRRRVGGRPERRRWPGVAWPAWPWPQALVRLLR